MPSKEYERWMDIADECWTRYLLIGKEHKIWHALKNAAQGLAVDARAEERKCQPR